jgi:AsmA protein
MDTNTSGRSSSRPLWRSSLLAGLILAAAVLAGAMLPLAAAKLIGQETLRQRAQEALAEALERPVQITGAVRLTVVPWIGLRAEGITVDNPAGFSGPPLLTVEAASLSLSPGALLSRNVVVRSVSLSKASLNLERDASGRDNWTPPGPPEPQEGDAGQPGLAAVSLPKGLTLNDASLRYLDKATGLALAVRRINLRTTTQTPFAFSLSLEAELSPPGARAELHVSGEGSAAGRGAGILVHKSRVEGYVELPARLNPPGGRVHFSGDAMVHGEGGAFELAGLTVEGLGARLTGRVNAAGLRERNVHVNAELAASASRDGAWTKLAGLEADAFPIMHRFNPDLPAFTRQGESGDIRAELSLAVTPLGWSAKRFHLSAGAGELSGQASNIEDSLSFDVTARDLDAGGWLTALTRSGEGAAVAGIKSVRGSFRGFGLRLGDAVIEEAHVTARGEAGTLRLYPVSARFGHALLAGDLRLKNTPAGRELHASASLESLGVAEPGKGRPPAIGELSFTGAQTRDGLAGSFRAALAEPPKEPALSWLPERSRSLWSTVGAISASGSVRMDSGKARTWSVTGMDLKTGALHVTGGVSGQPGALWLDLFAQRLEYEKLRTLEPLLALRGEAGGISAEAKIGSKKIVLPGIEADDVQVSLTAKPGSFRLTSLAGAALGGRFSGGLEYEDKAGRPALSARVNLTGARGDMLHALAQDAPRLTGLVDCRVNLDAEPKNGAPLWQSLRASADIQTGSGWVFFSPREAQARPWPLSRAQASLKIAATPVKQAERGSEAVLADVAGTVKVESPSMVRSTQIDLKGQAGLDAAGKPLWYRQPRLEAQHLLDMPFAPPGRGVRAAWHGRLEADFVKESHSLSGVELDLAGIPARASLTVQAGQPAPPGATLSGTLDVLPFNPRDAAHRLGYSIPRLAPADAWRTARFSAAVAGTPSEIRLERIQAALDASSITGSAVLGPPRPRLELNVDSLDLDRISPAPQHADPARRPDEPLPLRELRDLALDARIRFGRFVKDKLVWENAMTEIAAQNGILRLRQSAPFFYGGPYLMEIGADARGAELRARMDLKISGFSAPPLLRDMTGSEGLTRGTADFAVNVETHGATERALKRYASGTASFDVRGGRLALKDSMPKNPLPEPIQTLNRDSDAPPPPPPSDGVDFTRFGASFTIHGGLATTRDLVLAGTILTAKGDGWVNLDEERIDLSLLAQAQDVKDVPVRISGPLYDPRLDVDKSKIIGDTILNVFKGVIGIPGKVLGRIQRVF